MMANKLLVGKRPNTACSGWWGVCAFFGSFLALSWFRFDGKSALRPTTANAHRWAALIPGRKTDQQILKESYDMRTQPLNRSSIILIILLFACIAFLIFGPPALSEWSHTNYLAFLQNLDESDVVSVLVYHNLSAVGSPVLKLESSADQHAIQQLVKALNGVANASGTRDYIGEPPLHMKIELIDGEHIELSIPQRTSCGADIHLEFVTLKNGPFLVQSRFTSWKEMRSWLIDQGLYKYLGCNTQ